MFVARKKETGTTIPEGAHRAVLFDELVSRHAREIQLFLYKLSGNHHDAEELAQDVFVKAFRKLDHLRDMAASRRWLFSIAINHFNDWLKPRGRQMRRKALTIENDDLAVDPRDKPLDQALAGEFSDFLRDAIGELPERQRCVLLMFSATGFDYGEIGQALGVSADAVKMSLFHAREKLRERVDRYLKR